MALTGARHHARNPARIEADEDFEQDRLYDERLDADARRPGQPRCGTLFFVLYLYRQGFETFQMGYASALAWVLFGVILVFTLLQFRLSKLWVYYEGGAGSTPAK